MTYRNSFLLLFCLAFGLWSDVCLSFSIQSTSRKNMMRTRDTSSLETHTIGQDDTGLSIQDSAISKRLEERGAANTNTKEHSVDLALVGGLACLAAMGMVMGLSLNGNLVQSIESTDNGSAATFIVDAIFGAIAVIVSLMSGNEEV